jgi:hypothetical protein
LNVTISFVFGFQSDKIDKRQYHMGAFNVVKVDDKRINSRCSLDQKDQSQSMGTVVFASIVVSYKRTRPKPAESIK